MIEVACGTDEHYAPHCATMLQSLLSNNRGADLRIHLLHDEQLRPETLSKLGQLVQGAGAAFQALPVPAFLLGKLPGHRFHVSCWHRILLPTLLPDAPRVLYLDADMLVLGDLRPLWDTDLRGQLFGAVINPLYPFMGDRITRELQLSGPEAYLNSGVLLMDLAALRRAAITARVREYAGAHPDNAWPEQDALSVVCQGQWLRLPPRWNVQTTLFDLAKSALPFPQDQIKEALTQPVIVHFIGPVKPWHYLSRHPLRHLYAEHRRQTPWPQFDLEGRTWKNMLLRPFSLGTQIRLRKLLRAARAVGMYGVTRLAKS